jgi:hypothetical protein
MDLVNQLGRVWIEKPDKDTLRLGRDFEDKVYQYASIEKEFKSSEHFRWFVDQCKGGIFQKKLRKIMNIDGEEYCLYGKSDVWFPDIIKDIKTTHAWKGEERYLSSFQHKMYCYVDGIMRFSYLVAEFQDLPKPTIVAHHEVKYETPSLELLEGEILETIAKFISNVNAESDLKLLYETKFC